MSCWVKRNFVNIVKCCLWQIRKYFGLFVNSANTFLHSSVFFVCNKSLCPFCTSDELFLGQGVNTSYELYPHCLLLLSSRVSMRDQMDWSSSQTSSGRSWRSRSASWWGPTSPTRWRMRSSVKPPSVRFRFFFHFCHQVYLAFSCIKSYWRCFHTEDD